MQSLFEQYRPKSWADVVGQDKVIAKIDALRRRGLGGRAFWLAGQSGTGKTTIARLIAAEIADEWAIEEIDATGLSAARLAEIERSQATRTIGKGGAAFIVNEAHGLNKAAIRQLLVMLERLPEHVVWIFTTTSEGQEALFEDMIDAHPLLSRCVELPLSRRDLAKPFAARLVDVAQREGIPGWTIEKAIKLTQECRNNLRAAFQKLETSSVVDAAA